MRINQTLTSRDQCTSVPDAVYTCGGTDGWRRAAYLNMTEYPNTECPSGWQLFTENSKRACGKSSNGRFTCDSVFFPVAGGPYSQVCGRIRAYQKGLTSAFIGSSTFGQTTIDSAYVSGVAVMHGSPRQHIWTFVAGGRDNFSASLNNCPCDPPFINRPVPSFVGEYYFCESGYVYPGSGDTGFLILRSNDPLWDGQDCHSTSSCCSLHNPPFFTKHLGETTSDDLELRMCIYGGINTK